MTWPFGREPVSIRPLQRKDAPACGTLHGSGFAHPWSAAEFENLFDSAAVAGEAAVLRGGFVAGFVLSRRAASEAEILTLIVRPNRRRQGIGRELMNAHLGRLGALGVSSVFLEVDERNAPARALYSRLGFEEVGARPAYYRQADGARSAALILRCPI